MLNGATRGVLLRFVVDGWRPGLDAGEDDDGVLNTLRVLT